MRHRIPGRHHPEQNREDDHRGRILRAPPDRADNKAGNYSHGWGRRIALIGAFGVGGKVVSGVRTKAKWRHGELAFSPALDARMRAKAKSWFIPSRDPTYAPVVRTLCASAEGSRDGAEGRRIPIKPMVDGANRLQCWALHFCASAGRWGLADGLSTAASGQVGTFSLKG